MERTCEPEVKTKLITQFEQGENRLGKKMSRALETYGPVTKDPIFRSSKSWRENREGKVDKAFKEIMI